MHGVVIKHDNAIWRKRGGIGQSAGHRGVLSAGWRSFGEMGKRGEMESGVRREWALGNRTPSFKKLRGQTKVVGVSRTESIR